MSDLGWWYLTRGAGAQSVPVARYLALHADDFGMNGGVNEGILRGFSHGLLTSTAVLANGPAASSALGGWKELSLRQRHGALPSAAARQKLGDSPRPFDLGVHLNLTQGRPLTGARYPAELLDAEGRFPGVLRTFRGLLRHGRKLRPAVAGELKAQIAFVLDHGVSPTHLNGHQYVELMPAVDGLIPELMAHYSIGAVRVAWEPDLTPHVLFRGEVLNWGLALIKRSFAVRFWLRMQRARVAHPGAYFGTAHAGRIDLRLLESFIASSPGGVVEIGVHPGRGGSAATEAAAEEWDDPLAALRGNELALITSAELVEMLESRGVRLGRLAMLRDGKRVGAAA